MNDQDPLDWRQVTIGGLHPAPKRVSTWRAVLWEVVFPVGAATVLVVGLLWWLIR